MTYLIPYRIEKSLWSPKIQKARDAVLLGVGRIGKGLAQPIQEELTHVLEIVNSYSSNRMEGNPTKISDIFSAKEGHLASTVVERNYQLEHLAHIETAESMRLTLIQNPTLSPADPDFLQTLHKRFYEALPDSMRFGIKETGEKVPFIPGQYRIHGVLVGRHRAVSAYEVPDVMQEFARAYRWDDDSNADALVDVAAAHHRFLWIHPFPDGNGRVARLMTEAMAIRLGMSGGGLYSVSRGLARRRPEYDARLAAADVTRHGDLDGRGNLTLKGLIEFCEFFLEVMSDQINFMADSMEFPTLYSRYGRFLNVLRAEKRLSGSEATVLSHLFRVGEMPRGAIQRVAGVERRQATTIASRLLGENWVKSSSPKGPLRFKANRDVSRALFPDFFE